MVGARIVIHTLQFNGKQGDQLIHLRSLTCAVPATVSERVRNGSTSVTKATESFFGLGRQQKVVFASPDTGQQGGSIEPLSDAYVGTERLI